MTDIDIPALIEQWNRDGVSVEERLREALEALSLSVSPLPEKIAELCTRLRHPNYFGQEGMRAEAAAALEQMARENERLQKLAKCDSCGKPFNENGGICEPCHSSAIGSHIKPLGERIRELEAERGAIKAKTINDVCQAIGHLI